MADAIPFLRLLFLASLVLAEGAATARAETVRAKLLVSAEVLVSCRLDANVPRVGPHRPGGTASFSVTCTRAATAAASACDGSCSRGASDGPRSEYRMTEIRGDGTTVATVFF